jgi:serine/threonine protein phosphatase 1
MFSALRNLFRQTPRYAVPEGQRVYAVGDIHGRSDLFDRLLETIRADAGNDRPTIVLLGDYVDRGPDSRGVVARLLALPGWADWVCLKGNHEAAMLDAFADGPLTRKWLDFGGRETLQSYGAPSSLIYGDDDAALVEAGRRLVPQSHIDLIAGLPLSHRIGDYLFVHAGLMPGRPLEDQGEEELLWIRGPFLDWKGDHGCVVVHGHSIVRDVTDRPNRIGIDTGAYRTNKLTAVALEGTERRFLST